MNWGERLIRGLIESAWQDEILGDLSELRAHRDRSGVSRGRVRYAADIVSILLRCGRRQRAAASAVVMTSLAVMIGIAAVHARPDSDRRTFHAHDDAGAFTLQFSGDDVVAATLDGRELPSERITQSGRIVLLRGADRGGDLVIRVTDTGGIEWDGRSPQ